VRIIFNGKNSVTIIYICTLIEKDILFHYIKCFDTLYILAYQVLIKVETLE